MSRQASVIKIIGRIFGVLLIILAVFLAVTSMTFYFGGSQSAPNILGYNIYLVRGGDFYQLKSGTAALAQSVWPDEIKPGEIIIYNRYENGGAQLGRVNTATLKEAVMSYDIETEQGENITISQGQYIAKVTHCSDFLGLIIGFAMSPFGVMAIAILPCIAIFAFELVKFIISRLPTPEVETVKLQQETPTFIPIKEREAAQEKRLAEKESKKRLAAEQKILTQKSALDTEKPAPKADEFTEHLKSIRDRQNAEKARDVRDRTDFSPTARQKIAQDLQKSEKTEEKRIKPADKPSSSAAGSIPPKNAPVQKESKVTAKSDGEPDISLVLREDEDKGFDIDDILADIEKRHN